MKITVQQWQINETTNSLIHIFFVPWHENEYYKQPEKSSIILVDKYVLIKHKLNLTNSCGF